MQPGSHDFDKLESPLGTKGASSSGGGGAAAKTRVYPAGETDEGPSSCVVPITAAGGDASGGGGGGAVSGGGGGDTSSRYRGGGGDGGGDAGGSASPGRHAACDAAHPVSRNRLASSSGDNLGPIKQKDIWKAEMRKFLDDPRSSKGALIFAVTMLVFIVASVGTMCMSSYPKYEGRDEIWVPYEWVFNSVFTMELISRIWVAESFEVVYKDVYLYFDFVAVFPFWIDQLMSLLKTVFGIQANMQGTFFTLMKALRMLRLLKISRQYDGSIVIVRALKVSIMALGVPFFFLMVAVIVFASFLYYLEYETGMTGDDDSGENNTAAFHSIPHAIWFMLVTMTTVGYGDVSPNTAAGKFITVLAMVFGVLFLSMPLAIVGNNFCVIWDDKERVIFIEKFKEHFLKHRMTKAAIEKTFAELDLDNSGTMSFKELRVALEKMKISLSSRSLAELWRAIDNDNSGEIRMDEFVRLIFEDDGGDEPGDDDDEMDKALVAGAPETPPSDAGDGAGGGGVFGSADAGGGGGAGGEVSSLLATIVSELGELRAGQQTLLDSHGKLEAQLSELRLGGGTSLTASR